MDGVTNNSRPEIEAAIAKAVELRALHASLMQGNTPPPFPPPLSHFSAHDYPVFSPQSYVDEPLPGYAHLQTTTQIISENWEENQTNLHDKTLQLSNYTRPNVLSRKELPSGIVSLDNHILLTDDTKSVTSWCTDQMSFMQNSPGNEILKSRRRNSLEDNNCKPATINTDNDEESIKHSKDIVVPLTESRAAMNPSQLKPRGVVLSWLLPRFKRKQKNNSSPGRAESEVSHGLQDFGAKPTEVLMKELVEANQKRDLAFAEVSEMRSSFGELRKKLESLESYCEELKKGLQHSKRGKLSHDKNGDKLMPVSEEDMIEGFLQIVSEARLSVKKTWSKAGKLQTTKAYDLFRTKHPGVKKLQQIWNSMPVPKHRILAWTVYLRRLPTIVQLQRKGFSYANRCYLCLQDEESQEHLFFKCQYMRKIWSMILQWLGIHHCPRSFSRELEFIHQLGRTEKIKQQLGSAALLATMYHGWQERNNRVFNNISQEWSRVCKQIQFDVACRAYKTLSKAQIVRLKCLN